MELIDKVVKEGLVEESKWAKQYYSSKDENKS
jgi:hypothetical protein